MFEHLPDPEGFLKELHTVLAPGGVMFLSWTNWLSPWGGHDFSPFHYLGPRLGPWVFDRLRPGKRVHFPYAGLWPTYIGRTIRQVRRLPGLEVMAIAPRYYTEFALLMRSRCCASSSPGTARCSSAGQPDVMGTAAQRRP